MPGAQHGSRPAAAAVHPTGSLGAPMLAVPSGEVLRVSGGGEPAKSRRESGSAHRAGVSVEWRAHEAAEEEDGGGACLVGRLRFLADGESAGADVLLRSPLGLVPHADLELIQELGHGSFGNVSLYKWRDDCARAGEPHLALKTLLPSAARDVRALRDFAEEVALLSQLQHPHIVACYGAGLAPSPAGDVPFLAMEALTGGDLRAVVTRATMEPGVYGAPDVARWALQTAAALHHLHTRQPMIIYRDLKLENIMLDAHWNVRLTDLGLAKVILQDPSMRSGRYVMTGGTGSLKYMAPEVVRSNKANERVDQYSYAIVLWELLSRKGLLFMRTARQPNGARVEVTPAMWAEEAARGARPRVAEEWPQALRGIMMRCWHPEPLRRPRFAEVIAELEPIQQKELWTDPTKTPPPKAARSSVARSSVARSSVGGSSAAGGTEAGCACAIQ